MRSINYKVRCADGSTFVTSNYEMATTGGNRIIESILCPLDEKNEKQREKDNARARKVWEKLKIKTK